MSTEASIQDAALKMAAEKKRSVSEMIEELSRATGSSDDAITKVLIRLSEERMLILKETSPYKSLAGYALSPYSLWFWGAAIATILSLPSIAISWERIIFLRYLFTGALFLFLPGFSITELLYAKKGELDELERLAFSVCLSLALTPLTGLVLNYTPFGIRLTPMMFSLAGLTVILLLLALRRKHTYYKLAMGVV